MTCQTPENLDHDSSHMPIATILDLVFEAEPIKLRYCRDKPTKPYYSTPYTVTYRHQCSRERMALNLHNQFIAVQKAINQWTPISLISPRYSHQGFTLATGRIDRDVHKAARMQSYIARKIRLVGRTLRVAYRRCMAETTGDIQKT